MAVVSEPGSDLRGDARTVALDRLGDRGGIKVRWRGVDDGESRGTGVVVSAVVRCREFNSDAVGAAAGPGCCSGVVRPGDAAAVILRRRTTVIAQPGLVESVVIRVCTLALDLLVDRIRHHRSMGVHDRDDLRIDVAGIPAIVRHNPGVRVGACLWTVDSSHKKPWRLHDVCDVRIAVVRCDRDQRLRVAQRGCVVALDDAVEEVRSCGPSGGNIVGNRDHLVA